ncbi:MAG: tetratricopeptide repeat protein [Paraglaciecola sp.]|nr:tetratricopeptide repeat protein [Paraglaciecola sp.]
MMNKLIYLFVASWALLCLNAIANDKTISLTLHERLSEIEQLSAENHYKKAQQKLDEMLAQLPRRDTDRAYVFHQQARLFLQQEKYNQARDYLQRSYQLEALNTTTQAALAQLLANLFMHVGKYRQTVHYLQDYFKLAESPDIRSYLSLGTAHFQLQEFEQAILALRSAVDKFAPNESATVLLFACYHEIKQLKKAEQVMEKAILFWPNESKYWLQLASVYSEQNKLVLSLEILELAFQRNLLVSETSLQQYVYSLYEMDIPYKAALVLEKFLDQHAEQIDYKNASLLAALYISAREHQHAIKAYNLASELSDDGRDHLYLAQLYYEQEDFDASIIHANYALEKGVESPGNVHMLLAAVYHENDDTTQVKRELKQAATFVDTRESAIKWLKGIDLRY